MILVILTTEVLFRKKSVEKKISVVEIFSLHEFMHS